MRRATKQIFEYKRSVTIEICNEWLRRDCVISGNGYFWTSCHYEDGSTIKVGELKKVIYQILFMTKMNSPLVTL